MPTRGPLAQSTPSPTPCGRASCAPCMAVATTRRASARLTPGSAVAGGARRSARTASAPMPPGPPRGLLRGPEPVEDDGARGPGGAGELPLDLQHVGPVRVRQPRFLERDADR